MSEQKLFTEAEARVRFDHELTVELRERGLIAPEPVDEVRLLAVQIKDYLNPQGDDVDVDHIAAMIRYHIAATERPTLTREMVDAAMADVFGEATRWIGLYGPRLHAAIVERMTQGEG
jgi:hypothetical protein